MAKAQARQKEEAEMRRTPKAPASNTTPEPSAFERMQDLTRRIVHVPKSELARPKHKGKERKRRS
jgi:hypothetical protein